MDGTVKIYSDCVLANGDMCMACKEYIALEDNMSTAKNGQLQLNNLAEQRLRILTRINRKHDILTTRLPVEIVCSIFQFCVPEKWNEQFKTSNPERHMVSEPLLLGRICKSWRDIAWGVSPLWTMLRLHIGKVTSPYRIALTREWLQRTGQLPVSIRLSAIWRNSPSPKNAATTNQLVAVINQWSKQWRNLDISGPSWLISKVNGGPDGAPNLQALRIIFLDTGSFNSFTLTGGPPQPSHLHLESVIPSHVHINWTSLTHVSLLSPMMREVVLLLQRALNLVHCEFDSIRIGSQALTLHEPIFYHTVEILKLKSTAYRRSRASEIIFFFKSFIFPNLKHLTIESGGVREDDENQLSWAPVLSNIIQSSPPLISLVVLHSGPNTLTSIILPILHGTPSLRELGMLAPCEEDWDEAQNKFFQLLADTSISNDGQPQFLPNLRVLKFHVASEKDAERLCVAIPGMFGPITDIHNPRRRPLKTLVARAAVDANFNYADIRPKNLVLQLMRLRKEGIVLDIKDIDNGIDVLNEAMEQYGLASNDEL